jgi:hypothetical protein
MIAAFHPPATFSVRFVIFLRSPTGEKRYLCVGWCFWDLGRAVIPSWRGARPGGIAHAVP